ncbi:hypothetical protein LEMLEM_LOCUS24544 [Lemmus lemmus]
MSLCREKCWPIRQKAVENRASANQAEGHAQPFWADKGSSQGSTPSFWIALFGSRSLWIALSLARCFRSEKVPCTKRYSHLGSGFGGHELRRKEASREHRHSWT